MNEQIRERFDSIDTKLDELNDNILSLTHQIDKEVVPSTSKMSSHIDFIEHTYSTVSRPLHFICNKVNRYIGHDNSKKNE